jgi:hypothetical protein
MSLASTYAVAALSISRKEGKKRVKTRFLLLVLPALATTATVLCASLKGSALSCWEEGRSTLRPLPLPLLILVHLISILQTLPSSPSDAPVAIVVRTRSM